MLKMNIPLAAVRQRMEAELIPPSQIDSFFTGGASIFLQDNEDMENDIKTKTNFDSYIKMLRVGMGEGAVMQKMRAAGLTIKLIDQFLCDFMDGRYNSV